MECRPGCGACCIAPSISSPIPGHPDGKPAGIACMQLDGDFRCRIFGRPERPAVCTALLPESGMCCGNREEALVAIDDLERATGSHSDLLKGSS